ncbi:PREDICTED: WAT1-related protein At4g01440-like [Nicotiana attenuata]|uniref:WAT1-related protein n=1 Tax=Nicotiana attenuata TaxID=49451 RepID=A0A314KWK1_NICAT|nr:PREDICTED: WAT1-related protein At4g01440-like [Nicotiana attenuata]OIT33680.1 wat1-related protein [Nicotiana attenuata]
MKSCVEWYPIFIMLAIDFAFAISNILLKKIILDGMNHLVFITYRQSISTIFLAPIAFFLERNTRPKLTPQILCNLFLSAIVGASLTQYLFLLGIEYTSATFSCAFVNMVPVITFLMALPFGLETINIKHGSGIAKLIGTLICVGGAFILTFYKGIPLIHFSDLQHVSPSSDAAISSSKIKERWILGSLALFAGTFLWSSWFLLQSFIGNQYPCKYSSTVIMTFFSAIQSAILTLSIDRRLSIWIPKEKIDMLTIVYAGLIGSGMCYVGMSWCVKKRGPVFTAAFSPLVQIMAAMFDVPILHEQLHLGSVIGSAIVIAGLYFLLWGKNREMQKVVHETEEKKDKELTFKDLETNSESRIP